MALLARRSGVSTPTIKHYIREHLLPGPVIRTSRNMAYYDARIVARIQAIKTLQAEQFLPLRVIGELLEPAPSASLRADARSQRRTLRALVPAVTPDHTVERRRRTDVIRTSGVSRGELTKLEHAGVLELLGEGATAGYAGPDLDTIDLLAEIRRLGYGEVFPITIGAVYLEAVGRLLAVEIEMFRQHALHASLPAPLPDVARQAVRFGERLVVALRSKLLPAVLERLAAPPPKRV